MAAGTGPKVEPIRFPGRNRADAKRKALNYWYMNKRTLCLSIKEFSARCRLASDGSTVIYYPT